MSRMVPPRLHPHRRSPALLRGPLGRLLGAGAIVTSIGLHGAAAALALVVLPRVMPRSEVRHQERAAAVEIDMVAPAEPEPTLESAVVSRATRRPAPRQRPRVSTAPAAASSDARPGWADPPDPERDPVGPAETPRPATPRFVLSAGSIAGGSDHARAGAGARGGAAAADGTGSDATSSGEGAAPLSEGAVDRPAQLATAAPLRYPEAARRAELELDLPLEIVVSPQGRVRAALALSHPGYGLEEAALAAVRSYVFLPARRAGREVPVRMRWTMQFRLR